MSCLRYCLKNNTTEYRYFTYFECDDATWMYDVSLNPGQTKNIWLSAGTYRWVGIASWF